MYGCTTINIYMIEVNLWMTEECLNYLNFVIFACLFSLLNSMIYVNKAIKYGRTRIFIQTIYFSTVLKQNPTDIRRSIKIIGVVNQMMKRISFL